MSYEVDIHHSTIGETVLLGLEEEIMCWRHAKTLAGICDVFVSHTQGNDGHLDISSTTKAGDNAIFPSHIQGVTVIFLAKIS